ncbi:MAG: hypothetical protein M1832_002361 [Thelocarpon impressellum]|nr:MAG: hypothetical protein M1832_002361 [Thelocarpon impressellum]
MGRRGKLPPGCHHYTTEREAPDSTKKYFSQRYDIFEKYDEGVWMTDDAWFGVTPEPVANMIAEHLAQHAAKDLDILVDAFAGAGGNSIAFARSGRWKRVIAIEQDAAALKCAQHNAKLYGVERSIQFLHGDCFEIVKGFGAEVTNNCVIFASPPWGGPGYRDKTVFDLSTMQPYSVQDIHQAFSEISKSLALYLPRTSSMHQIAELVPDGQKAEAVHYCVRGSSKDDDDQLIQSLINADPLAGDKLDVFGRALEPGEKADDAVDYEDIDDDDLADEDDAAPEGGAVGSTGQNGAWQIGEDADDLGDLEGFMREGNVGEIGAETKGGELDELFGDLPLTNGHLGVNGAVSSGEHGAGSTIDLLDGHQLVGSSTAAPKTSMSQRDLAGPADGIFPDEGRVTNTLEDLMAQNFAMVPAPPENREEALATMWPKFRDGEILRFMELLPPKRSHYMAKAPLKTPKSVLPTKVSLELAPDQEKTFQVTGPAPSRKRQLNVTSDQNNIVTIWDESSSATDEGAVEMDEAIEDEVIGGVTWRDLEVLCGDWDSRLEQESSEASEPEMVQLDAASTHSDDLFGEGEGDGDGDGGWARQADASASKRRKLDAPIKEWFATPSYAVPSLDDPERATSRIAKSVVLDLNDPRLLVDVYEANEASSATRRVPGAGAKRKATGSLARDMSQRYNISNDEAYDLLKENHQSKVRSTLGNLTVEHSMPALRLQYPYYKVKLATREARSFHRPALSFVPNVPVKFSKPRTVKRKNTKGKEARELFQSTKDLSLGDNSHVLLLEYSEEYPTMMSNFGMGSRLINYYRRKDMEDNARPKLDIGETAVLLPQDKSPFSIFGNVEPGQMTPALYNAMFRAPVFKQHARSTDFLVIRNTTGVEGSSWYMRNIENLYIVGQEFPSVDVPGPHSRKVTTAAKNRLKMISFRKIRRNKPHRISVGEVTEHFPDTTDMQNRQKMKEFMQYSKDHKEWEMRPGDSIPDQATLRAMVKPEDVCLLESSQIGQRHLQDAGYGRDAEDSEEDDGKEGQSLEQQLAPWHTTRNFLHATQGKAMLQLHGEGDPSGRGEAFSFIRTSMKGGFRAEGESAADKMDARRSKENGGHSYNVARQQKAYQDAIRRIWEAQKTSLSSTVDHSEMEADDEVDETPEDLFEEGRTPRSQAPTPAAMAHRGDDETTSQFSKLSTASQRGRLLRISRDVKSRGKVERVQEVVRDHRVIREYLKRRHAIEAEALALSELRPTGDADQDKRAQKRIQDELARLERNKDRRIARDKQKGIWHDGAAESPGSPSSPSTPAPKSTGTQRKCANCGQVGHIKTNKKLCPMLNGTMKQEDGVADAGFGSMTT